MIAAALPKIPIVVDLLPEDHNVAFLEVQVAESANANAVKRRSKKCTTKETTFAHTSRTTDTRNSPWHLGDIVVDRSAVRLVVQVRLLGDRVRVSHRLGGDGDRGEIRGDYGRWCDLVTAE